MASSIAGGAASQAGVTVLRALSGALLMPVLFHFLEPSVLGGWMLFSSLGAFIAMSDMGLSALAIRATAYHRGARETRAGLPDSLGPELAGSSPQDLRATLVLAWAGLGLLAWLIAGAGGWAYLGSESLGLQATGRLLELRLAWLAYAAGLCMVLAGSFPNYALQGGGELGTEARLQGGGILFYLASASLLLYFGQGPLALGLAFFAQQLGVRILAQAACRSRLPWLYAPGGSFRGPLFRELMQGLWPLMLSRLGSLLVFQLNTLLIGHFLGSAAVPAFAAAQTLSLYGAQIAGALPQALMPHAASLRAAGDFSSLRRWLRLACGLGMNAQLAWSVMCAVFGAALLQLWLGPKGLVPEPLLWAFAALYALEFHTQIHAQFAFGMGHWPFAKSALAAGALAAALGWILVPKLGLLGAALATLGAQALTNFWYAPWVALKQVGMPALEYLRSLALPLVLGTALLFAAALLVRLGAGLLPSTPPLRGIGLGQALGALLGCAILGAASLGLAWRMLDEEGRGALRRRLQPK